MHTHNLDIDISLEEITKIEGTATCDIEVRGGEVTKCQFAITEMRRFFEEAIRGKPIAAVPGQVARVCGTCSNAHLLCSLYAIENAIGLTVTPQVQLLRELLNFGLIIRDHALHLYVFSLPDLYHRNSILEFDENNPEEHRLLDDCFAVKHAGNQLGIAVGGRSVHAPFPRVGGFAKIPTKNQLMMLVSTLSGIRPAILFLLETFMTKSWELKRDLRYVALNDPDFTFLKGSVMTNDGTMFPHNEYSSRLSPVGMPYSQADGFRLHEKTYMVGALARVNMFKDTLHPETKKDTKRILDAFPSNNIFHNNVAQALEILHAIDRSIDLIHAYGELNEPAPEIPKKDAIGYGIIEAPRGLLYHEVEVDGDGMVKRGKIIVPTGQNQIGIEESIKQYVEEHLDVPKEELELGIEAVIRAYDPCMSCATHFLKIRWK